MVTDETERKVLLDAVEHISDLFSCRSCNDVEVPNNEHMRIVLKEYNLWNSGAKDEYDNQWIPFPDSDKPTVTVHSGVIIFLLKKNLGLI